MKTVLEVAGLNKSFGETKVLNNINLTVNKSEFLAIMGRSGSGKSTLLYGISGMDSLDSGKVLFNGDDITSLDDEKMSEIRLKHMGFIFQHTYLLKKLSIRDNIVLPGFKAAVFSRDQICQRAERLMKTTGIESVAANDVNQVSGGELQRAGICRALINNPDILFGDEPTGALNSSTTNEVMDIINDINSQGTTAIIVTHDTKVASRADRVIFLVDGNINEELILGKYSDNETEKLSREKLLSAWLEKQGF